VFNSTIPPPPRSNFPHFRKGSFFRADIVAPRQCLEPKARADFLYRSLSTFVVFRLGEALSGSSSCAFPPSFFLMLESPSGAGSPRRSSDTLSPLRGCNCLFFYPAMASSRKTSAFVGPAPTIDFPPPTFLSEDLGRFYLFPRRAAFTLW